MEKILLSNEKGKKIKGMEDALKIPGITIFHAGTELKDKDYFTSGGRVIGVCAADETLAQTMDKIYKAISKINFEAMHYRRDIGASLEGQR